MLIGSAGWTTDKSVDGDTEKYSKWHNLGIDLSDDFDLVGSTILTSVNYKSNTVYWEPKDHRSYSSSLAELGLPPNGPHYPTVKFTRSSVKFEISDVFFDV